MRICLVVGLLLVSLVVQAAPSPSDIEQARRLISLPSLQFEFGMNVDAKHGFRLAGQTVDLPAEIDALKAHLQGDASDAPRYLALARLYEDAHDANRASNACVKAITLGRRRLEAQPQNTQVLRDLGESLAEAGEPAEAEVLLRRATQTDTNDWQNWVTLGKFLADRAMQTLLEHLHTKGGIPQLFAALQKDKPSAAQVQQAERCLAESRQCLDTSVALAPAEPAVYLARGQTAVASEMARLCIRVGRGEKTGPEDLLKMLAPDSAVRDLRRACDLRPGDPHIVTTTAIAEFVNLGARRGVKSLDHLLENNLLQSLPESEQEAFRSCLRRLAEIGRSPIATNAAAALQALGTLQMLLVADRTGAEANFRRCVALDPRRENAWDGLMVLLDNRKSDRLAVAESRVKVRPSTRNYVALAKVLDSLDQPDKAERAAEQALALDRKSFLANHTLGVVRLKQAKDRAALLRAKEPLVAAKDLMTEETPPGSVVEYFLNCAIYNVLVEDLDSARALLKQALHMNPESEDAQALDKILKRLEKAP
jgi:tetratricopeptide (TPR) repeat protein